eukprot:GHVT01073037.1.p1 GENE.GHVT01073037.1~~GHVT01073037.1.p1  ORF type:complete len:389 (+),score=70.81 GHVT01073037.1:388-1554(+)
MQVYKASWCVFFSRGRCTRGSNCSFAHSSDELRQLPDLRKTKLCHSFTNGTCELGDACGYAHGMAELRTFPGRKGLCRLFREGKCNHGDRCKYAHTLDALEVGFVYDEDVGGSGSSASSASQGVCLSSADEWGSNLFGHSSSSAAAPGEGWREQPTVRAGAEMSGSVSNRRGLAAGRKTMGGGANRNEGSGDGNARGAPAALQWDHNESTSHSWRETAKGLGGAAQMYQDQLVQLQDANLINRTHHNNNNANVYRRHNDNNQERKFRNGHQDKGPMESPGSPSFSSPARMLPPSSPLGVNGISFSPGVYQPSAVLPFAMPQSGLPSDARCSSRFSGSTEGRGSSSYAVSPHSNPNGFSPFEGGEERPSIFAVCVDASTKRRSAAVGVS